MSTDNIDDEILNLKEKLNNLRQQKKKEEKNKRPLLIKERLKTYEEKHIGAINWTLKFMPLKDETFEEWKERTNANNIIKGTDFQKARYKHLTNPKTSYCYLAWMLELGDKRILNTQMYSNYKEV